MNLWDEVEEPAAAVGLGMELALTAHDKHPTIFPCTTLYKRRTVAPELVSAARCASLLKSHSRIAVVDMVYSRVHISCRL